MNAQHPRFAVAITVVIHETSGAAILAQLKNISLSGCYVETPRELKQDARVRVMLQTANLQADLWGVVRRKDGAGVGIGFTNGATVEDWKMLEELITELQAKPMQATAVAGS